MAKKTLEDKVSDAKSAKSPKNEDPAYYRIPKEEKDVREGKLEKVKLNGKKKGEIYESDAERMMRAEKHTHAIRQGVYDARAKDQEKYRKAVSAFSRKKRSSPMPDLGDAALLNSVAGKAIAHEVISNVGGPGYSDNIREVDHRILEADQAKRNKQMFREYKKGGPKSAIKEAITVGSNVLFSLIPFQGMYQNRKTIKHIKNSKEKEKMVFQQKGMSLSDGPIARQGRDFRNMNYHPYLINTLDDIKDFFIKVGKKPSDFADIVYIGHGKGANAVREDSINPDITKYGIKRVYQVAPIITRDEDKGALQKISDLFSPQEGKDTGKNGILHYSKVPLIDNYVITGEHDTVSRPDQAIDPHAKKHYTLKDGSATHYGTAGTNRKVNADLISLIMYHAKQKKNSDAFLTSRAADGYERRKAA